MKSSNILIAITFALCLALIPSGAKGDYSQRSACYNKCLSTYHQCVHDKTFEPNGEKVCMEKRKECETNCPN